MKEKADKIKNFVSGAISSDWFIALNAAIVLLGWALKVWLPLLCALAAINILPLFFVRQTKHLFVPLMMFSFMISDDLKTLANHLPLISIVCVLVAGMIFNVVFFKRDFSPLHPKNVKGFHASLLALIFPFAFAGISSPAESPELSVSVLALVVVLCAAYSFFTVCYAGDEKKSGLPEYVLKILFASGIVAALEMIICMAKIGDINAIVQAMMEKKINLGWANSDNVAPLLAMAIPASLYFCVKKNFATPLFATIALMEYSLILATGCRGAILFSTLAMPVMLFYTIVKSENKLSFGITVSVLFMLAVILVAYYGDLFAGVITTVLNKRLTATARGELVKLAVDAFKTWPIFGAGWDYRTDLFFNSTFFQILATMGLFGLTLFAVFYLWRYITLFKMRKDVPSLAILGATLLFEACGFVGSDYFIPNFFIILLLMTFSVEINLPKKSCLAFGGKDPVAHVVGFFRILADRVKPVRPAAHDDAKREDIQNIADTNDEKQDDDLTQKGEPK